MNPLECVEEVLKKVPKPEILRFYRVSDYDDTNELAASIAKKKGFMMKTKVAS